MSCTKTLHNEHVFLHRFQFVSSTGENIFDLISIWPRFNCIQNNKLPFHIYGNDILQIKMSSPQFTVFVFCERITCSIYYRINVIVSYRTNNLLSHEILFFSRYFHAMNMSTNKQLCGFIFPLFCFTVVDDVFCVLHVFLLVNAYARGHVE